MPRAPHGIALADMDGDGKLDLVTAGSTVGTVAVLLNRGNRRFLAPRTTRVGRQPLSLAVGDLNGDGKRDVATTNLVSDTVSVLIGRGGGRFFPRVDYPAGKAPNDLAIGDLNGDDKPDLVSVGTNVPYAGSVSNVSVFINRADGTYEDRIRLRPPSRPVAVAVGDLNGDGAADLAVASLSSRVSVFTSSGDGSFLPRVDYRAALGPAAVAIGDVDGDGKPDVIAANTGNGADVLDSVSVFLNDGDGGLQPRHDYGVAERGLASSVAIGDLNRDGRPDLAIGNDENTVSVFVNRGGGRFGRRFDYRTGRSPNPWGPRSVAIGDLNGDRKLDLATVKLASVAVLFGA